MIKHYSAPSLPPINVSPKCPYHFYLPNLRAPQWICLKFSQANLSIIFSKKQTNLPTWISRRWCNSWIIIISLKITRQWSNVEGKSFLVQALWLMCLGKTRMKKMYNLSSSKISDSCRVCYKVAKVRNKTVNSVWRLSKKCWLRQTLPRANLTWFSAFSTNLKA